MGLDGARRFPVAVFPMPDAVLFPGVSLPLQFRDERYRRMLREVRARGGPVAVSLATPGVNQDELLLRSVCGAGAVQVLESFPDGRSEAVLRGERRVRLLRVIRESPYLLMEAEDLEVAPAGATGEAPSFDELKTLAQTWAFLQPDLPLRLGAVFEEFDSAAALTDFFVYHFVSRVQVQQAYLSCTDVGARSAMLSELLRDRLPRLMRRLRRDRRGQPLH